MTDKLIKRILFVLVLLATAAVLPLHATVSSTDVAALRPTPQEKRATELITRIIENYHYKHMHLDDALSADIVERYLETLDANRSYFLAEDITSFSIYQDKLDDALLYADLDPAFDIFKVFRVRVDGRVKYATGLLDQDFDFTIDEDYVYDRSKTPWATDQAELDEIWRKRVKNDVLTLHMAGQNKEEIADTLRKRYEQLATRIHQMDADDVYQLFINSYAASLEPHTAYFSPRTAENFEISMSLSLEGIGAVLQSDNDFTVVRSVVPGGPADESGQLHTDDRIIGIGQGADGPVVDVVGWRLDDVVDLIRGPKGSIVRLQILTKGTGVDGPSELIQLTRNKIKLEEQAAKKSIKEIPAGNTVTRIGVISIPAFYMDFTARSRGDKDYRSTTRDVRILIAELTRDAIDGIIIDLRGNGGGSLAEATELTGLFIESGPIVQVKDSSGHIEIDEDPDPTISYAGPLAVLVDRNSASASEIFAAAIQDYYRGIVIGEPTFGKGTVQNLYDLDQFDQSNEVGLGRLKATVAQFFRINGDSTQHRGVVPDIVFPTATEAADQGERGLHNALPWDRIQPVQFTAQRAPVDRFAVARKRHEDRIKNDPGFAYLLEETKTYQDALSKTSVSLLEAKRRADREASEAQQLQRENQFRIARGLPPVSDNAKGSEDEDDDAEPPFDVLLNETAYILQDLIYKPSEPTPVQPTTTVVKQLGTSTLPSQRVDSEPPP
ncbi:MAG: carboxy terminal-processing peptidase [Gammaproteobacteria bacterium]|nr:carboxy terminal-processing peptidase [Gammaproteobacteria bacterium]MCI0591165.1 carboxy terminal-processing peptidase [Gammaproteobacteria bacterium]